VSMGYRHACALSNGPVCWGGNGYGELGIGIMGNKTTPTPVMGLPEAPLSIVAGHDYSCAVLASHGVSCWGTNSAGELGDGTTLQRLSPVNVIGVRDVVQVGVSNGSDQNLISPTLGFTCALLGSDVVQCWGNGALGRLGNGKTLNSHTPVNVIGLP
jgi:alpha-tubulin suppressor-like RCC1 family protein